MPARELLCSSSVGTTNWRRISSNWTSRIGLTVLWRIRRRRRRRRRIGDSGPLQQRVTYLMRERLKGRKEGMKTEMILLGTYSRTRILNPNMI